MAGLTRRVPVVFSQFFRNYHIISATKTTENFSLTLAITTAVPHRYSSFRSSKPIADLSEYPEVEVLKNPPEWKFVERLFPPVTVPHPLKKAEYPSGWQPPKDIAESQRYFVARTKSHMVPVYLHTKYRGLRRITVIRYIQGDIWSLERDLHKIVEESKGEGKLVASRVNELSGQIHFHGDYVNLVKEWLVSKGF